MSKRPPAIFFKKMPYETTEVYQSKLDRLLSERRTAREFQERRHQDWNDHYELYRNKVKTNRLTQRQAVNIPLMKETIKTILSKIHDAPNIDWREKHGDELKELIYQEIWNTQFKEKKFEWVDIVDKKNVLIYGISTKMLNLGKSGVDIDVLDIYDVVFDPLMNPVDIDLVHLHFSSSLGLLLQSSMSNSDWVFLRDSIHFSSVIR